MARTKRFPLRYRAPNPPPEFRGREDELRWLSQPSGSVAVVVGPSGVGKTSLLLQHLHASHGDNVLYLSATEGETLDSLLLSLLAAVSSYRRKKPAGMEGADTAELMEILIDCADAEEIVVALDDIHHLPSGDMHELLLPISSYARKSRWFVCSQSPIRMKRLATACLDLEGLSPSVLEALAKDLSPRSTEKACREAASAAAGSPWLLQQLIATGRADDGLSERLVLDGIADDARDALRVLSWLRGPTPVDVLRQATPMPSDAQLDALDGRGLLRRTPAGLVVHDLVRRLLGTFSADDEHLRERAISGLQASGDAASLLDAIGIVRAAGDLERLIAFVDRHVDVILAQAEAHRLWHHISGLREPRLHQHQMRCAAELGNATVLAALASVVPEHDGTRTLAWARTLYLRGDTTAAADVGRELLEADPTSVAALLLVARCALARGGTRAALASLKSQEPPPTQEWHALRVRLQCEVDVHGIESELAGLMRSDALAPRAALDLAYACRHLSRSAAALSLLDVVQKTPRGAAPDHALGREALVLRARLCVDEGRYADADALITRVAPFTREPSMLSSDVREIRDCVRLVHGEAGEGETSLTSVWSSIAYGRQGGGHEDERVRDGALRDLWRCRYAEIGSPARVDQGSQRNAGLRALAAAIRAALVQRPAVSECTQAIAAARASGRSFLFGEVLIAAVEILWLQEDVTAFLEALDQLEQATRQTRSRRYQAVVDYWRTWDRPAVLERQSGNWSEAPHLSRRSRALLGYDASLDLVDQVLVEAMESRLPFVLASRASGEWRPGWGLDRTRESLWLETGREVDLASRPLVFRLAAALIEGGDLSKEELAMGVWEERVYHPGRHDPRIHMSMRKLRELVEERPGSPTHFVTTENGYGVAGTLREARRRSQ